MHKAQAAQLKVLVLRGGPDREREVSLVSGAAVAAALREAGHDVRESDIGPDLLSPLDDFVRWGGDVVFPVLHGSWGEGGPLQQVLDSRQLRYVGCKAAAAALCMDKASTKQKLIQAGLPTAEYQLLREGEALSLQPPVVLKPPCEGSSIDLYLCKTAADITQARQNVRGKYPAMLAERYVQGRELTVGVIGELKPSGLGVSYRSLPAICIVPATEFYDYEAKYHRDDTQYLFDMQAVGISDAVLGQVGSLALRTFEALGCRHLSRVDFIVDRLGQPWILEVNTMPGFTSHSLLPKAAAKSGVPMPVLTDRLVRMALGD